MIYLTSDEHYGSKRALELSKRPFKDPDQMDEVIISNFNSLVKDEDDVWHLGDFGDFENLRYLPGNHFLIMGNYEWDECRKKFQNDFCEYKKRLIMHYGFVDVFPDHHYLNYNDVLYKLVHEPHKCDKLITSDDSTFNLYGHIHGRQMVRRYGIDVGVDAHHFFPISFDDVEFYRNAIKNHYDNDVFE